MTAWSSPPDARKRPSGEYATQRTGAVWPLRISMAVPSVGGALLQDLLVRLARLVERRLRGGALVLADALVLVGLAVGGLLLPSGAHRLEPPPPRPLARAARL